MCPTPPAAATIVVCDDEPPIRRLVCAVLSGHGYVMLEAGDGEQGLELVREVRPDVLILDLAMPRRSGLEVLAALRGDRPPVPTAVIVLSARTQAADVAAVMAAGADRFLAKPFRVMELVAAVEEALSTRRETAAGSARPAGER